MADMCNGNGQNQAKTRLFRALKTAFPGENNGFCCCKTPSPTV